MNKRVDRMWQAINEFSWDKNKEPYCLTYDELIALYDADNTPISIAKSFDYGFIKGMRYMKAQRRKAAKAGEING